MSLTIVGIGPGSYGAMTADAVTAIKTSEVVVGYTGYIQYVENLNTTAEIIQTGMRGEKERCRLAIERAVEGKRVSIVSGGDSGVYGMASLIYELSVDYPQFDIIVIPGVTAALACAAILGAPISGDFATVSLSDLLTPWELIEKRLRGAAIGDFVICTYNPASRNRADHLQRACNIILEYKPADTICGTVRNAYRQEQEHFYCSLEELRNTATDMFTAIIIGNVNTEMINGKMVTARGYEI